MILRCTMAITIMNSALLRSSFIAGQLLHAKALAPIIAPLVNSYKRLVPGYEGSSLCPGDAPTAVH